VTSNNEGVGGWENDFPGLPQVVFNILDTNRGSCWFQII